MVGDQQVDCCFLMEEPQGILSVPGLLHVKAQVGQHVGRAYPHEVIVVHRSGRPSGIAGI